MSWWVGLRVDNMGEELKQSPCVYPEEEEDFCAKGYRTEPGSRGEPELDLRSRDQQTQWLRMVHGCLCQHGAMPVISTPSAVPSGHQQ